MTEFLMCASMHITCFIPLINAFYFPFVMFACINLCFLCALGEKSYSSCANILDYGGMLTFFFSPTACVIWLWPWVMVTFYSCNLTLFYVWFVCCLTILLALWLPEPRHLKKNFHNSAINQLVRSGKRVSKAVHCLDGAW